MVTSSSFRGASQPAQKSVLMIVDDDPLCLLMGVDFFEGKGEFDVITAKSAGDAIEKFANAPVKPSFVLTDRQMPRDHDGFDLASWLREQEGGKDMVIVMHTGEYIPEEHDALARQVGIDKVFQKKPAVSATVFEAIYGRFKGGPSAPPAENGMALGL